jgi:hypothetical protein
VELREVLEDQDGERERLNDAEIVPEAVLPHDRDSTCAPSGRSVHSDPIVARAPSSLSESWELAAGDRCETARCTR